MNFSIEIGKRIKEARLNLDVTRKELGQYAYVSQFSIANYEVGRRMPDIETLCLIADYLGMTLDDLVGRIPPEAPKMKNR
ncbi:MAG: helix-turn-helix transcriptional regulator [Schaedlerella sp.]|nr:helix-turn-helix transcriptional regulator [Schaedlerella sp.]